VSILSASSSGFLSVRCRVGRLSDTVQACPLRIETDLLLSGRSFSKPVFYEVLFIFHCLATSVQENESRSSLRRTQTVGCNPWIEKIEQHRQSPSLERSTLFEQRTTLKTIGRSIHVNFSSAEG